MVNGGMEGSWTAEKDHVRTYGTVVLLCVGAHTNVCHGGSLCLGLACLRMLPLVRVGCSGTAALED